MSMDPLKRAIADTVFGKVFGDLKVLTPHEVEYVQTTPLTMLITVKTQTEGTRFFNVKISEAL